MAKATEVWRNNSTSLGAALTRSFMNSRRKNVGLTAVTGCLLLKVTGVGKKGFWSVVNHLTSLDLGARFNQKWEQRLIRLRRDWKISGKFPYA